MALPKLDAKFYGEIRKAKDDSVVPDDQYVVFLAKDNAFALVLPIYIELCKLFGCDKEQIEAITAVLGRVENWRIVNSEKCKLPDAAGEKLLDVST